MTTSDQTADLLQVEKMVIAYAIALDARDWSGFAALFEDVVEIDYSSIGASHGAFSNRDWADRCRALEGFDATHHKVTNIRVELMGDEAWATSYVDAAHFLGADGRAFEAYVLGAYEHRFVRHGGQWRIAACRLTVAGYPGGRDAFQAAFAAARANFARRQSP